MTIGDAIQEIRALDLKPGGVLLVKGAGSPVEIGRAIEQVLREAGIDDVVVIATTTDADLSVLDEGAMRELGWMRMPDPVEQLKVIRAAAIRGLTIEVNDDGR